MMDEATQEMFAAYRKASIVLTCWGLFLFGVVALIVCAKMGWL